MLDAEFEGEGGDHSLKRMASALGPRLFYFSRSVLSLLRLFSKLFEEDLINIERLYGLETEL